MIKIDFLSGEDSLSLKIKNNIDEWYNKICENSVEIDESV